MRDESYVSALEGDPAASGRLFRILKASSFLRFVSRATFASETYPGPLTHMQIVCLTHVIDVVSPDLPIITSRHPARTAT
ncbi:hypothetical protein ACFSCV_07220 [Methylopila henanensis]|uniref:Uncharacterized protein n=1 Tax=Methylopila henanensis TaxID=873516 RepID=A0ABW4K7Z4_9HYPH